MSRIRKLEISGIRNFGPSDETKDVQTIRFSRPLTLIFGPNGTGKTTIIESLKYVTTGKFPPGGGHSFIHDPLLTDEQTVKSVVNVQIRDTTGELVTVSRSMNCTRRNGGKNKFENLDPTLIRKNKKKQGEENPKTLKPADMDREIKEVLGVSESILNYVIFCHQEDSTWPLQNAEALKNRYDQIFGTEKYSKAGDTIREYTKSLKAKTSELEKAKASFQIQFDETIEKQKSLDDLKKRLTESITEVSEIMIEIKSLEEAKKKLRETEQRYTELRTDKETKETECTSLKQQIIVLGDNIKIPYDGTMDQLQKEISDFDNILTEKEKEEKILRNDLEEITKEKYNLEKTISSTQISIGRLTEQTKALKNNIAFRNHKLNELFTEWGLEGIGADITETDAVVYLDRLKKKLSELEMSIAITERKHQDIEGQSQEGLDKLRDQKSKLELEIIMLQEETTKRREDVSRFQMQEEEEVNMLVSQLKPVDLKLKEADTNVDTLAKSIDVDYVEKEIKEGGNNRGESKSNLDKMKEKVGILQRQSSQHAELDRYKTPLETKDKDIQEWRNNHQENVKKLLKVETVPEDLKISLDRVQESLTDRVKELNDKLHIEHGELGGLKTAKKNQEDELQDKNAELKAIQDRIYSVCHGEEYDEVLRHTKKTLQDLQDSKTMYAYRSIVYKDYIKKPESCCPLCERDFNNQEERDRFKRRLNDEVNMSKLEMCEEQWKFQQNRYDALQQLKPFVDSVEQLEDTIEKLKQEQEKLKQKWFGSEARKKNLQSEIDELKSELAQCKDIVGKGALWDRYYAISAKEVSLQKNVQELQMKLKSVNQQYEAKDNLLRKTKKENNEMLKNDRNMIAGKSKSLDDLKSVQSEIDKSIRGGVAESLKKSESDMKRYLQTIVELDKKWKEISVKIDEIKRHILSQEPIKKEMNNNMTIKRKTAAVECLEHEITELIKKLGDMKSEELREEGRELEKKEKDLFKKKNEEQGRQSELERSIKQSEQDLNKDIYRSAKNNFMNNCAELAVQKKVLEDLVEYEKAIHEATIELHKERVAPVNKIISDLWECIYKGKDTKSIRIDVNSTGGIGDSKRRVYNYKVVQQKNKGTIDMKERCSAGQKILASLIIRIALAETYAQNCGVIALDEPTTNLDETNIKSLANALVRIVRIRSRWQKNFQLIVISHDVNFVNALTKVDNIRNSWELYSVSGLTRIREVIYDNANTAAETDDQESSNDEVDARTEESLLRSKQFAEQKKQLAEERKQLKKKKLSTSPPRSGP